MKRRSRGFVYVWLAVALAVAAIACGSRRDAVDASKVPDELKSDFQIFETRCSKCHALSRPYQAAFRDDDQWVNYVNRMRRQPGSGITYNDQAHILRFLKWYAADLRRQDAEKEAQQTKAPPPPAASIPPPVPSFVPEPPPLADGGTP